MINICLREVAVENCIVIMFVDLLNQITWKATVDKAFGDENKEVPPFSQNN